MMDADFFFMLLLYYTILDGTVSAVRIRKQNVTRNREAALARLAAYTEEEFKRRFRMFRYQFNLLANDLRQ